MSLTNPNNVVTEERLSEFYQAILPYLGGMPDAICNKFDKANLYDTTEKVVGKWIDGKPLYQKVVDFGTGPNASSKSVAHGISNIDRICRFTCIGTDNSSYWNLNWPPIGTGSSAFAATGEVDKTNLKVKNNGNGTSEYYIFILQYTKTTDAANSFKYADENDYSTSEKIVGTWIDGKPLYQRVRTYDWNQPNATPYDYPSNISNIAYVVDAEMHAKLTDGTNVYFIKIKPFYTSTTNFFEVTTTKGILKLSYLTSSWYLTDIKIVWKYTKTTD